jgi:hypothetical protein
LGQPVQVAPPVPHTVRFWLAKATQVVPTQQPLAQLELEQGGPPVQAPPVQVCPPLHGMHAAPAVETAPHCEVVSDAVGTQVPAEQQPWHVCALQGVVTQTPAVHVCPPPQAPHAAPPVPHSEMLWLAVETQLPPGVQQPLGQLFASQLPPLHAPLVQLCPMLHRMQAAPGAEVAPHCPSVSLAGGMHSPAALQHPLAQVPALQTAGVTHWTPELHTCPVGQLATQLFALQQPVVQLLAPQLPVPLAHCPCWQT